MQPIADSRARRTENGRTGIADRHEMETLRQAQNAIAPPGIHEGADQRVAIGQERHPVRPVRHMRIKRDADYTDTDRHHRGNQIKPDTEPDDLTQKNQVASGVRVISIADERLP
nr:hypothetical protein [Asaia bogorensis]